MSHASFRQFAAAALICSLLGATTARADIVLDQSNAPYFLPNGFAMSPAQGVAQGITVGVAGILAEVDMGLYRTTGAQGTVTLSLLNYVNGTPDTDLSHAIYTATITQDQIPQKATGDNTPATLVAFNLLAAGIRVTKGEQLAIAMSGTGAGAPPWIVLAGGVGGYTGGTLYSRNGNTASTPWNTVPTNNGNPSPAVAFTTYVQTAATAVPEPSSLVLVGLGGAIGLGLARARRRPIA